MSFSKLDSGIIDSSIWSEPSDTRIVWITILAKRDQNGFLACSRSGLFRACNIGSVEAFDIAINTLEAPDPDSKTPDNQGRRIEKVDGGWIVLNHDLYQLPDDKKKDLTRERVRRFREKQPESVTLALHSVTDALPSISTSISESESVSKNLRNHIPPTIESVVEYCNERQNNIIPQHFFDFYESKNWMIGKNKMKDWQAAIRTWEQNNYQTGGNKTKNKTEAQFPEEYKPLPRLI